MLPNEPVTVTFELVDEPQAAGANPAGSLSVAAKINVVLAPQTFSTTADAQGRFSTPIAISQPGTYTISARGNISGNTVGPVTMVVGTVSLASSAGAPLANAGGGLAKTGADSGVVLWTLVGAGAFAAGVASVLVVRRRAKVEAAA